MKLTGSIRHLSVGISFKGGRGHLPFTVGIALRTATGRFSPTLAACIGGFSEHGDTPCRVRMVGLFPIIAPAPVYAPCWRSRRVFAMDVEVRP